MANPNRTVVPRRFSWVISDQPKSPLLAIWNMVKPLPNIPQTVASNEDLTTYIVSYLDHNTVQNLHQSDPDLEDKELERWGRISNRALKYQLEPVYYATLHRLFRPREIIATDTFFSNEPPTIEQTGSN